jgi:hypothetical protein
MAGSRTFFVAVLATACMLTAGVGVAGAVKAKTLGKTNRTPPASCPANTPDDPGADRDCQAVGRVTGFQMMADGTRPLFKARESGFVVAWAIDLSDPSREETDFFGDFYESNIFGKIPTARVSVIKRKDDRNYKLKGQSAVVGLNAVLGTKQTFTLNDPLKIRKGEFLALTLPTWAPSFAVGLTGPTNIWRSSRAAGACLETGEIRNGKPQQKVGSTREYGCDYRGARLLYWGYYVPRK